MRAEDIMAGDERLVTGVGGALAVCFRTGSDERAAAALDFPAGTRTDLLLRVFLTCFSNQRIDRAAGNSSRGRISARGDGSIWPPGLLVCADAAMVFKRPAHADRNLLGRDDRIGAAGVEFVAARNAGYLLCVFSFVRERSAGFFRVPIGRNAAGGGIYFFVFCAARIPAKAGRSKPAFASKLVPAAVGMLPNLLRIGRGKNHGRRPGVAELH